MPPETLMFLGEKKLETTRVTMFTYNSEECAERVIESADDLMNVLPENMMTWLNIDGIHDTRLIEKTGEVFGLHHLLLEDILDTDLRPKTEVYEDKLFLSAKMLSLEEETGRVIAEQVSFVLGKNFLITFQEGLLGDVFERVRVRLAKGKGKLRRSRPDHLLYELLDSIIDNYFIILEKTGDKLDLVEQKILSSPEKSALQEIHTFKSELMELRKLIWPLREIISRLERDEENFFDEHNRIYIRDIYDHIFQAIESVEMYRDMLSSLQDLYHSSLSNRMNEIMKVLTIITTIFIPLSFIAGVYGMNFRYMPELFFPMGYPVVLLVMTIIGAFMLYIFRKKGWL
ncbi:MAG: magnesium transport protein CorA [Ignavibacteriales bacterium]